MIEIISGTDYSLEEIDAEISSHIPEISRRACTPRVMAEVDALLDQRNEVIAIASCFAIEQEIA